MRLSRDKLIKLMNAEYDGNYSKFGRALGIDISHLYRFLNTGVGGGKKIFGAVMGYCVNKGLKLDEFLEY